MRSACLLAGAAILAATAFAQPSPYQYSAPAPILQTRYDFSNPETAASTAQLPATFVKKLGAFQQRDLVFSMCASADGNIFMAGRQGNNPMIAKITPLGQVVWVRHFPPVNPNEPIEWASVLEDSDGMLILCGTEGASPSNRRAIVMRYNLASGTVSWYRRYASNRPIGVSIVEKSPGGNFVLQTNYQELPNNGLHARSEFVEINRNSGSTTGSSVGYSGLADISLVNTVAHNGNLYVAGSWGSNANYEVRPFFAKLEYGTFIPAWTNTVVTDTATGGARWMAPADLAFDGDAALITGSGHLNPLSTTGDVFVFLEKHRPDGSLEWLKRYDMAMVPEEVLPIGNAYVIFGRMAGSNQIGMLKTDVDGNVLTARVLAAAPASPVSVGFAARQNLVLRMSDHLLLADHTWELDESDIVLCRTDLDFRLDDPCDAFSTLAVGSQTLTATIAQAPIGIATNTPAGIATTATAVWQAGSLPTRQVCPKPDHDPDPCQPNTFLRVYGDTLVQDGISALCTAPDGNFYVAGQKANGYAIGKMDRYGNILWLRNFTSVVQDRVFVTEILVDSEGMIAGAGNKQSAAGNEMTAFRYDPKTNHLLWERRLGANNPAPGGIIEKGPGGNYLLYYSPSKPASSFKSAEILELDRSTGQIVPAFSKRYIQQASQVFAGMVLHGDALYVTGYTDSLASGNAAVRRMMLAKLDAHTGDVLWSRVGLMPWSQTAYFSGIDLIVDDNSLITLSHGIETSNSISGSGKLAPVYLHKTTLGGEVLWARKYLFNEMPREVVAVPDGYVIFCGWSKRYVFKTDKMGNLLFARQLDTPGYFTAGGEDWPKNQIDVVGSYLCITDNTAINGISGVHTTFLKTDTNLDMEFDCGLVSFSLKDTAMTNPTLFATQQVQSASPATAQPAVMTYAPGKIPLRVACPACANPPCTDKPDLRFRIESVGCDSAAFVNYQLCNSGEQPFAGVFNIGVYDANPLVQGAKLLDFFELPVSNLLPDSCQSGTLKKRPYWGPYGKVYTLAGITSALNTPIDPNGFPYNDIVECDYLNNLDSLDFEYPPAPKKPDLGPDLVICAGKAVTLDAGGGFVSYGWSNSETAQAIQVHTTGTYIVHATDGCGRIQRDTAAITLLPQPAPTFLTIEFYPGDTIAIGGQLYTHSDTVTRTLTNADGCDSVVTYFLQQVLTNIALVCPADIKVTIPANQPSVSVSVSYPLPTAATDCPDAGIALTRLQGPPPGGAFGQGITQVCYEAANACGIRDTCCFTVTASPAPDEKACDVKTPPGSCIRFELLDIRLDAQGNPHYRMRLTNNCASSLAFAWFQLPEGLTAEAPVHGATYTTPGGNTYEVRNPQLGPFRSIRFKRIGGDLKNGASDVFEYTLPKQAQPLFILVSVKLADGTVAEAHLNTFACPALPYVGATPPAEDRHPAALATGVRVYPNPTDGLLLVQLHDTSDETAFIAVLNVQGQFVLEGRYAASEGQIALLLPEELPDGLYYLRVQAAGVWTTIRFVLKD